MASFIKFAFTAAISTTLVLSLSGFIPAFEKTAYGEDPAAGRIEGQPLRLLVVESPLTYTHLANMDMGYEFEVIQHFALDAGFKLQIKVVKSRQEMIRLISQGKAELGAARFNQSDAIKSGLLVSPAYDEDKLSLICDKNADIDFSVFGTLEPDSNFRLAVSPSLVGKPWIEALKKEAPLLKISAKKDLKTPTFFKQITKNKIDCTVADRLEARYYLRFFKNLKVMKDVSTNHSFHFLISNSRPDLERSLRVWATRSARRQVLSNLHNSYRERIQELPDRAVHKLLADQERIFPQYAKAFHKHSQEFAIPWQLAAAVAYQESHWDSEAESFTGVKGIMQLTEETAEHLGVEDRTNPEQSIWGGIKYLRMLIDRQPKGLAFKEKLSLALATYNVGPAHMIDAQTLAKDMGKNPYSWQDIKSVLPLLGDKEYADRLKYGPARGTEPVEFVRRVFAYLDLISAKI